MSLSRLSLTFSTSQKMEPNTVTRSNCTTRADWPGVIGGEAGGLPGPDAPAMAEPPCSSTIESATVTWPTTPLDPFFNANTMDDIAEAERLAALDGG